MADPLMRSGLAVSAIAHAALIAWGVFSLPSPTPLDTGNFEQIPVDFVELGDVTKLNKGVQTAALVQDLPAPDPVKKIIEEPPPLPKPEPKPEPVPALLLPPPPTPAPPQPPPPEPAPDPTPPADAAPPAPAPDAEAPPPPEEMALAPPNDMPLPRLRPSPPQKPKVAPKPDETAAIDQITALLDKRKLEQMAAAEPTDQPATLGAPTGTATAKMTVNELDALRARLAQCWSPPLGWTDPSEVRVVLMLSLNVDGSVNGVPSVLESPQGQYANAAPESALRAVRRCAPYNLPAEKYDAWKQVKVTFDPKDMGGA